MKMKVALRDIGVESGAALVSPSAPAATAGEPAASEVCPSCGEMLAGNYCHACGEERAGHRDLSLKHFAGKTLREITDFEHSKTFRTFSTLLLKPGFLTKEYLAGRRNIYLTPLKICFLVFALYLFTYSFYKPVALFDFGRIAKADETGKVSAVLINRQAAKKGIAPEVFIERVNEQWHRYMSLLQITGVLVFAVLLQIIYLRSGRYFVEHLIFSMHFISFAFLCSVLMWPLNLLTGLNVSRARMAVIALALILVSIYLFLALARVYRQTRAKTLAKTLVSIIGYQLTLMCLVLLTMTLAYIHVLVS
jgi:hypothetical protein